MEDWQERPVVYLDMNAWVAMVRGSAKGDQKWAAARSGFETAISSGHILVTLAAAHYLEHWHRRDLRSREQVEPILRDVSGYAALLSPYLVRRREVRAFVTRLAGVLRLFPSPIYLLGFGVGHAFGSTYGRFR